MIGGIFCGCAGERGCEDKRVLAEPQSSQRFLGWSWVDVFYGGAGVSGLVCYYNLAGR